MFDKNKHGIFYEIHKRNSNSLFIILVTMDTIILHFYKITSFKETQNNFTFIKCFCFILYNMSQTIVGFSENTAPTNVFIAICVFTLISVSCLFP